MGWMGGWVGGFSFLVGLVWLVGEMNLNEVGGN